ncbi:hypothetical protein Trydic_g7425 [Trypoxylus dichotomus]
MDKFRSRAWRIVVAFKFALGISIAALSRFSLDLRKGKQLSEHVQKQLIALQNDATNGFIDGVKLMFPSVTIAGDYEDEESYVAMIWAPITLPVTSSIYNVGQCILP